MDLLPQIPQSMLFQWMEYINMECNVSPFDLSVIKKQIESYIPLVNRIGDGNNFSGVMVKFLFLMAIVASTLFSETISISHY